MLATIAFCIALDLVVYAVMLGIGLHWTAALIIALGCAAAGAGAYAAIAFTDD